MSRRTLAIILFVSLAVNVFLIGAVVGGLVVGQRVRHERPAVQRGGQSLWAAGAELPPEKQRAFRQIVRGDAGEVRNGMREAQSARAEAWRSVGAEPFDPAAAKRGLDAARLREMQVRAGVEGRIVDFAGTLSPSERKALAERLSQLRPGRDQGRLPGDRPQRRPPERP